MVIDKRVKEETTETTSCDGSRIKILKEEYEGLVRQSERLQTLADIMAAEMADVDKVTAITAVILHDGLWKAGGKS